MNFPLETELSRRDKRLRRTRSSSIFLFAFQYLRPSVFVFYFSLGKILERKIGYLMEFVHANATTAKDAMIKHELRYDVQIKSTADEHGEPRNPRLGMKRLCFNTLGISVHSVAKRRVVPKK